MYSLWSRRAACLMLLVILAQGLLTGCSASTSAPRSSVVPSLPPTRALPVPTNLALSATEALVLRGQALFRGEEPFAGTVSCASCHTTEPGARDAVGPNLAGIAVRGATRVKQLDAATYIEGSIRVHDEFIVPGFSGGLVPALVGAEFGTLLTDEQVIALVAYLLTLTDAGALAVPAGGSEPAHLVAASPTRIIEPSVVVTDTPGIPSATALITLTITHLAVPAPTTTQGLPTATSALVPTPPTTTSLPVPTPEPPTATRLPVPTPEPPTVIAPTVTTVSVPPEPPTPSLPSLPSEGDLGRYANCVTCHSLHPLQVQMPHPLNPTCNTCHRGSPNQLGCLSCHSTHGIDNKHEPSPDLACASCHN